MSNAPWGWWQDHDMNNDQVSSSLASTIMPDALPFSKPEQDTGPRCKQCGARMQHFRRYGYKCSANREHKGIVWPGMPEMEDP